MRKALICPTRYVQGEDELLNLGYFVKTFGNKAMIIARKEDVDRVRPQLEATADKFGVSFVESGFCGQCTREEIARIEKLAAEKDCPVIIGLGGGKALDTAKCVAKGDRLIIVPTIAATDAPTSHSAVMYHEDNSFDDYAYFKQSPSVVLVDTKVIAQAPTRFLVSGMGDALSTYFEARATHNSYSRVNAGLPCGEHTGECEIARGTNAALALAKACYESLLEDGLKAKESCDCNLVTPAFENIVETNILLSGLGFESGGLSAAHAIYDGLSIIEETHAYYHGEQVAFGTLCQLVLEDAKKEEFTTVLDFCLSIGLPVCLEDIGVKEIDMDQIHKVAEKACISEESIHSMPCPITVDGVANAIVVADRIGRHYKENHTL